MEAQWRADRLHLRTLLTTQPGRTLDGLAAATGRSRSLVKKSKQRLCAAPDDQTLLHSQSRARKHPPPALSQIVIDLILGIRDAPPHNLTREAIGRLVQDRASSTDREARALAQQALDEAQRRPTQEGVLRLVQEWFSDQ